MQMWLFIRASVVLVSEATTFFIQPNIMPSICATYRTLLMFRTLAGSVAS